MILDNLKARRCLINPSLSEKKKLKLLKELFVVYQAPVGEDTFVSWTAIIGELE